MAGLAIKEPLEIRPGVLAVNARSFGVRDVPAGHCRAASPGWRHA
jgi:hypothetical protein